MNCISLDMTIDTVLRDPMIAAAMRADRVDPRRFETLLRATARRIGPTPRAAADGLRCETTDVVTSI